MLDTLAALLVVRLRLLAVALLAAVTGAAVAVALSTSAVTLTSASSDELLLDESVATGGSSPDEAEGAAVGDEPEPPDVAGPDVNRQEVPGPEVPGPEVPGPEVPGPEVPGPGTAGSRPAAADTVLLPACPADIGNHGAYVSSVARDERGTGREHGQRVAAAARSDCGKPSREAAGEGKGRKP